MGKLVRMSLSENFVWTNLTTSTLGDADAAVQHQERALWRLKAIKVSICMVL